MLDSRFIRNEIGCQGVEYVAHGLVATGVRGRGWATTSRRQLLHILLSSSSPPQERAHSEGFGECALSSLRISKPKHSLATSTMKQTSNMPVEGQKSQFPKKNEQRDSPSALHEALVSSDLLAQSSRQPRTVKRQEAIYYSFALAMTQMTAIMETQWMLC
jgi:hypothetical protein